MLAMLRNNKGNSLIGALVVMVVLGGAAASVVSTSGVDTRSYTNDMQSQQSLAVGNAGLQWALDRVNNGYDPSVDNKHFGAGYFDVVSTPGSSLITVTSFVGDAKRVQSINADYARNCFNLEGYEAVITGNVLSGIELEKDCNEAGIVSAVTVDWNSSACAIGVDCEVVEDEVGDVDDDSEDCNDDDSNNGHGNDCDHDDDDNPGQGGGNHGADDDSDDNSNDNNSNDNSSDDNSSDDNSLRFLAIKSALARNWNWNNNGNNGNNGNNRNNGNNNNNNDDNSNDSNSNNDDSNDDNSNDNDSNDNNSNDNDSNDDNSNDNNSNDNDSNDDNSNDNNSNDNDSNDDNSNDNNSNDNDSNDDNSNDNNSNDNDSNDDNSNDEAEEIVVSCMGSGDETEQLAVCAADSDGLSLTGITLAGDQIFDAGSIPVGSMATENGAQTDTAETLVSENGSHEMSFEFSGDVTPGTWFTITVHFADGSETSGTFKAGNQAGEEPVEEGDDEEADEEEQEPAGFSVDDGVVVVDAQYQVDVQILGSAITCGAGGSEINVASKLCIDGTCSNLFNGADVDGGESYSVVNNTNDAEYTIRATASSASCGNYNETYESTDTVQVRTLLNGETAPALEGFGGQQSVQDFLDAYIDDSGNVVLAANQVIMLFEMGTDVSSNPSSTAADFQDLVVLMTITEL